MSGYESSEVGSSRRSRSTSQYRNMLGLVQALARCMYKNMAESFKEVLYHSFKEHRFYHKEIDSVATGIIIPFIGKDIRKRLQFSDKKGILRSS